MEEDLSKGLSLSIWIMSIILSVALNFNLVGALIIKDWNWIMNNWLSDIGLFLTPIVYIIVHFVLIFGYKNIKSTFD
jgi:hypothetical protein